MATALMLWLVVAGCKKEREPAPAPAPSAERALQRGQVIVVEQTAAVFEQTRVLEVDAGRLRVDSADGGESIWIERADVYTLDRSWRPGAGALGICQHRSQWLGCRVESSDGSRVQARDADGRKLELAASEVLEPRPLTELNLKRSFERAAGRRTFLEAYARAGTPAKPKGWLPAPRARVIAAREGQWYSAQIHEFDEEVPRVSFALDGRITELPVGQLAPEPPYPATTLSRGDFVLVRPPGPAQPWKPVEIRSLGDQELRVADVSGELATVSLRDVVPLSADR